MFECWFHVAPQASDASRLASQPTLQRETATLSRMPTLSTRASGQPAVGQLLVLTDEASDSRVELAPRRGALVTSIRVRGRELLYLDTATLNDASKSVRGGIPVLFPSPGRLLGDAFAREGRHGALKQHGFARNLPWTPSATADSDRAAVTLTLVSNEQTRRDFPWDFQLELGFTLQGAELSIDLTVRNTGSCALPFAFGLHPYFAVTDKQHARIDTQATRVFDNVSKTARAFHGFDLTVPELDLHLLDHGSSESALHLADGACIAVRASREFQRWVVWTLQDKDFVCLEPWTAPFDALNTGEGLLHVAPGAVHHGSVQIALV
ncbi:MAG: put [Myxococcaceae bacterium]|nr:put [Myxococcaceae bacterium]